MFLIGEHLFLTTDMKARYNAHKNHHQANQDKLELLSQQKQFTEEKYLFLLDNINQGFCIIEMIWDEEGRALDYRFLQVNKAFERQTGIKDAVGRTMKEIEPAHETHWFQIYGEIVKSGQPKRFEAEAAYLIDGWYEVEAFPVGRNTHKVAILFNDISERKRAERLTREFTLRLEEEVKQQTRALKESQDLLRATLDSSKNVTQVWQAIRDSTNHVLDFKCVFTNKLGAEILEKALGTELLSHHRHEESFRNYLQIVETGRSVSYEQAIVVDGKERWYDMSLVKLHDGVVVKGLDITERKEAEIQLRTSNQLLQSVFDTSLIGMSVLDAVRNEVGEIIDFRVKIVSKQHERETKRSDLVGKLYSQEYPGIKEAGIFDLMLRVMKSGQPGQMEYFYTYNGFHKWFSCMFVRMADSLVATNLDITERKLAEDKIKEDDALLRGIAEAAPDMLYVIDIRSMQMVYGNNKIAKLLQRSLEDIREMGAALFDQIVYPDDRAKFDNNINMLRQTGDDEVKELVYRLIDGYGKLHWVQTRRTVFKRDAEGHPTHIIGLSLDITEQVYLQQKNLQLRLERSELEKRQQREIFMATLKAQEDERRRIAENLHNGLGQLLYSVKLHLEHLKPKLDDGLVLPLLPLKQAERLLSEAIRESRRISHELMPSILEDFGLQAAIEDICEQFSKTVKFECQFQGFHEKLDKHIEIAIFRMVQELVINIIRHANATKGTILIALSQAWVTISVADDGIGFGKPSAKRGIGLNTIQNKIRLLNGSFEVHSAKQRGTIIDIRFPNKKRTNT
ncbi:PAS domain S-box protein [Olivibacter sp. XZL3]|uniref:PAS domain-containing sensor histidine kinase n=1 Tax=Olivibacter sp. XZL3 TaxID=1735116 RepID=UPI0010659351|nr:PAS domain S-box protein [Olivibacter sp. XZL3]